MIIFIINDVLDIHLNNMVEIRKKLVSHYDIRHVLRLRKIDYWHDLIRCLFLHKNITNCGGEITNINTYKYINPIFLQYKTIKLNYVIIGCCCSKQFKVKTEKNIKFSECEILCPPVFVYMCAHIYTYLCTHLCTLSAHKTLIYRV